MSDSQTAAHIPNQVFPENASMRPSLDNCRVRQPVHPNDIDALKALLLPAELRVAERAGQVADLRAQLTSTGVEIEHFKLMIAKLRRMQFGRKSEKLDHQIEQLELQLKGAPAEFGKIVR